MYFRSGSYSQLRVCVCVYVCMPAWICMHSNNFFCLVICTCLCVFVFLCLFIRTYLMSWLHVRNVHLFMRCCFFVPVFYARVLMCSISLFFVELSFLTYKPVRSGPHRELERNNQCIQRLPSSQEQSLRKPLTSRGLIRAWQLVLLLDLIHYQWLLLQHGLSIRTPLPIIGQGKVCMCVWMFGETMRVMVHVCCTCTQALAHDTRHTAYGTCTRTLVYVPLPAINCMCVLCQRGGERDRHCARACNEFFV